MLVFCGQFGASVKQGRLVFALGAGPRAVCLVADTKLIAIILWEARDISNARVIALYMPAGSEEEEGAGCSYVRGVYGQTADRMILSRVCVCVCLFRRTVCSVCRGRKFCGVW